MVGREPLHFDPIAEAQRHWESHGWRAAAPGMAVVTSVMRVQQVFLAAADEILKPFGLTFARYEVLMLLLFSREGRLPLGKIGERLQVHAASVTNAIGRLEEQGFVCRSPNPVDGRGILAEITTAGRRTAQRATREMNASLFTDLGITKDQQREIIGLLRDLRHQAGDFE